MHQEDALIIIITSSPSRIYYRNVSLVKTETGLLLHIDLVNGFHEMLFFGMLEDQINK